MKKKPLKGTAPSQDHRLKTGEVQINVDIPKALAVALKKYAKSEGTKVKVVCTKALLRYLIREGAMRS